jgi:glutamate/tyrosine decarboxylase-like PLP-dependent enzyme
MSVENKIPAEESLDPEDWEAVRQLGHRMLDDMFDYLEKVRQRPVWQPVPAEVKDFLKQPLPQEPQAHEKVYQDFVQNVLPYPMGNIHPRFWSWVMGNGTAFGMLAEMLAAGMNPNMGGGEHVGIYVERQVLDWTKALLGFPPTASGLLVSGGSMANLIAVAIARNVGAGVDVRAAGLQSCGDRLTLYASVETHSSVQKAVELLGLGHDNLRLIPVDDTFRIDLPQLEVAIAQDRAAGLRPICVIGNAGTVNTGAIDPLEALGKIARREGLWYHVDGAIGALSALAPDLKPKVAGMAQADSITLDFHKWLYAQFEAGCILVRDEAAHLNTFSLTPEYLEHGERGVSAGKNWPSEYGVQLTRNFRALKIWMSLREHGAEKYGRLISQNAAQARYLGELVKETPELELLTPVQLNITCFRYNTGGRIDAALNALNKELLFRLHESGLAAPSYTTLNGRYWLRAANTNHRTRREDFDLLVREVVRLGGEIASEG